MIRHFRRFFPCLVLGFLFFFLSSCGFRARPDGNENKDFYCGKNYLREGKRKEALQAFLRAVARSPKNSADAHFECGEIYLTYYKDPISAIYHYREFLLQNPNGKQSPLVRQRILTAEKAFLEQIPALKTANHDSRQGLLKTIKLLQDENSRLKKKYGLLLAKVQTLKPAPGQSSPPPTPREDTHHYIEAAQKKSESQGNFHRRYKVVGGDTLSKISCKVYGSPLRWQEIFDANRHLLKSPARLRIGQELVIPD